MKVRHVFEPVEFTEEDISNGEILSRFSRNYRTYAHTPDTVRRITWMILKTKAYKNYKLWSSPRLITHKNFFEFFTKPEPEGLGQDWELLKRVCSVDKVLLDALDQEEQSMQVVGTNQFTRPNQGIGESPIAAKTADRDTGTKEVHVPKTPNYAGVQGVLRRLRKDFPEIHAKVLAEELSPSQAAIQAGFKKKRISLCLSDPHSAAMTLLKNSSPEFVEALIDELKKG